MITPLSFLLICSWILTTPFVQLRQGWEYKEELISGMESRKDTMYIEDRHTLIKVSGRSCRKRSVSFSDKKLGLLIYIRNSPFNSKNHNLDIENNMIDGKTAYGIDGTKPYRELSDLKIMWDTTLLTIPLKALHNLYDLYLCNEHEAPEIEAYVTRDQSLLYIYISGSDGAAAYSVKFVFNRTKYLTRIIGQIECMDQFDFLDGHGNCE